MSDRHSVTVETVEPDLHSLLALSDDLLKQRLLGFIRQSGVKFRSRKIFDELGWPAGQAPRFAKFWKIEAGAVVPSRDPLLWDLREPLLQDAALACCCVLLHRRARNYDVEWIGGMETAAIPIVAGMLAVNRACGGPALNGFYIRKQRKKDGLRRLLEGPPPPPGARVVLVDDLLNKGISKKPLIDYCHHNGLEAVALLVLVDTERQGADLFASVCPVESLFTRSFVLRGNVSGADGPSDGDMRSKPDPRANVVQLIEGDHLRSSSLGCGAAAQGSSPAQMTREDIELVRLARDTVIFAALSRGQVQPMLREGHRGNAGYSPFLGRYLRTSGVVFTRISKREFKDGRWFNRHRGCQAVGLLNPEPGAIAEMTVKSALVSATRARKVKNGPAVFHKPVWPEEIGSLSVFVYLVEELVPTNAQTAEELLAEGHDVHKWGLIVQHEEFRGVICSDLDSVPDIQTQITAACRKMQNHLEIVPHESGGVTFIRMKGRWLWDPARPKPDFF